MPRANWIWSLLAPAATIGQTIASGWTTKSTMTGHVVGGHGLRDRRVHVLRPLAAQAEAAVRLGQLHEVRHPPSRPGVQVGVAVPPAVQQGLPLADHAEAGVVDDRHLDRDLVDHAGGQLLVGHLEAAVAVDRPHRGVRPADLGPHGRGHGVAHRAQAAGVEPGVGVLVLDELRGPHLVLPDAGDVDRVRTDQLAEPLDHELRCERAVFGVGVAQRVRPPPRVELGPPGRVVRPAARVVLLLDRDHELGQDVLRVADDRDVGRAVLADLGRVHVGVHDGRVGGEAGQLAGHPVVEPRAEADDEVGLLQRGHRGHRAVHARHAEVRGMRVGQRAPSHQRGDDRRAAEVDQAAQLLAGPGLQHTAADVQHRLARLDEQPGGLADLLAVRAADRPVAGEVDPLGPVEGREVLQGVLADVDEHRSGPAGAGDVERLGDGPRDLVGLGHQVVVLRHRHGDAADVGLLEGIGADGGRGHLAGDRDERHRVHVGVGDRRHQVGRPRSRGRHADAHPAGRDGVALRGVAGALLVADQDVPHRGRVQQRVVRREDRAAGDAEDDLHPRRLQRPDQALRPRDRLGDDRDRRRSDVGRLTGPCAPPGPGQVGRARHRPARPGRGRVVRRRAGAGRGTAHVVHLLRRDFSSVAADVRVVTFPGDEKTPRSWKDSSRGRAPAVF